MTDTVNHPLLGRVIVHMRLDTPRAVARWKDGQVHLSVPRGAAIGEIMRVLDSLAPRLLDARSRSRRIDYAEGSRIEMPGLVMEFRRGNRRPRSVVAVPALPVTVVEIGAELDMDNDSHRAVVGKAMSNVARYLAPELLLPRAWEIARNVGMSPLKWTIARGRKVLGTCTRNREIRLSGNVVFLPQHLRDYIVCHELAHLSEMNHGSRFHALCDSYCGGRERELQAELRAFRFPFD